jgi:hypothetical protein
MVDLWGARLCGLQNNFLRSMHMHMKRSPFPIRRLSHQPIFKYSATVRIVEQHVAAKSKRCELRGVHFHSLNSLYLPLRLSDALATYNNGVDSRLF